MNASASPVPVYSQPLFAALKLSPSPCNAALTITPGPGKLATSASYTNEPVTVPLCTYQVTGFAEATLDTPMRRAIITCAATVLRLHEGGEITGTDPTGARGDRSSNTYLGFQAFIVPANFSRKSSRHLVLPALSLQSRQRQTG